MRMLSFKSVAALGAVALLSACSDGTSTSHSAEADNACVGSKVVAPSRAYSGNGTQLLIEEDGFVVKMQCNPAHPVYQAHFPGNPITPGACLLQTASSLMQNKMGRPLFLTTAKNIKYLSLLIPEEGKEVKFCFSHVVEGDTECKTQVVIADDSTVYTKMSLTYSYEPL